MQESALEFIETRYFTPDDFARDFGIWPIGVGRNIAKPNYSTKPRALEHCSIHFVIEGKVEVNYGTNRIVLFPGDSFCMFPGVVYQYRYVPSEKPLSMYWISFHGPLSEAMLTRIGFRESTSYLKQVATKELLLTIKNLFHPASDGPKGRLRLQSSLYGIFSHMMPDDSRPANKPIPQRIAGSLKFMDAHYAEGITVKDAAASATLHRAYFSKIFTEHVGMSPKKYLENLKMAKSLDLLRNTSYTVSVISHSLGYSDPYAFTHAFTRYFGVSPGKWRKEHAVDT
ncbi:AraC family transcriptional regulator [Paenibacillus antri]|uniref:AraC family transcriptional regulator n=1 Tax=Paenibacillus antri TaxID=2582848 RepID=A0A5R9GJN0_9BACL|nr:AraC family transcriptional regulator [Paenibacillus antri]TLS51845.1 AraC family transcriptional regulator [Paenibacillus antri]